MTISVVQAPSILQKFNIFELQPGKTVDIEINHPVKVRIKVPVIGYEMGRYIILKYPVNNRDNSYQDVLQEGNVVIARYILEGERGECCAFRSTIRNITRYPECFLILNYPKKIESRQLRLQQRIVTHLPATMMFEVGCDESHSNAIRLDGIIADISIRGCGFVFKAENHQVAVNKRDIFICMHNPTIGEVKIAARVCNSRNEQGKVSVGLQFFDSDKQVSNLLAHLFINESML